MAMLDRKLRRDLWRIRGQALAIALVIGAGVAMFVMALGTLRSLDETRTAYYERTRFAEVFARLKRAPLSLRPRIGRIDGVRRVEARIVEDVTLDVAGMAEPAAGRLISLPPFDRPLLNDVTLREGRMPAARGRYQALVNEAFAEAHGLGPGDRVYAVLNGKRRPLEIVGIALSPEFVYAIAPGGLMPDDRHYGVFWLPRETLAAAFDLDGAFNDVSLTLRRGANPAGVIDALDRILDRYGGTGAYARADQRSNWYLSGEIRELKAMSLVLPPIFLAVAAFLLNIVISRLVATEREQIGLLKAFGYGDWAVAWHYVKLVLVLTVLGIVFGAAAGVWLGHGLTELYTQFFRFPFLHYEPGWAVFAIAGLASIAAALAATIGRVVVTVRIPPAAALEPPPPPLYRHGWLEPAALVRRLSQEGRMILRHTVRWPLRTGLTVLGIALAVAVLLGASFMTDAFDYMVDVEFNWTQRQQVTLTFTEPRGARARYDVARLGGVLQAEPYRSVPSRIRHGHLSRRVAVTGVGPAPDLSRLLDVRMRPIVPPPRGLVLSKKLAELLAVAPGDTVTLEVLEGRRPVRRMPVVGVVEQFIGTGAYMDLAALDRLMGEDGTISGAYLKIDGAREQKLYRELKAAPAVAGVLLRREMLRSFRETIAENLLLMTAFNIAFACCIAFGVVYNSTRIALSERGRELATLRVLGFSKYEVGYILLGQMTLLTLVALPIGCALGYGLAWLATLSLDSEVYRVPLVIAPETYGYAILAVAGSALFSGWLVARRVSGLDLIAVLKTRE